MTTASHDILEATDPQLREWLDEGSHALCARPPKRSVAETMALIDGSLDVPPGTPWGQHEQEEQQLEAA